MKINEKLTKDLQNIKESGDGYIEYSDGTLICYGTSDITAAINNQWGSSYYGQITNATKPKFAKTFKSKPTVIANINTSGNLCIIAGVDASTTQITTLFLITFASQSSYTGKINWIATGRWK